LRFLTISGSLANVPEIDSVPLAAASTGGDETLPAPPATPGGTLVFQLSSGGDIMVINADGAGLRRLTTGIDPALSPDGQTVAFTRWQGETGSVWLIGIDGSNERQISEFVKLAKGPAWSPDGSQLVINYQQGGRLDEKTVCEDAGKGIRPPRNASDIRFKLDQDSDGDFEAKLCWDLLPDRFWNLRVINLADGAAKEFDGGTYAFRPAWDPARPWRIISDGGRGLVEVDLNREVEHPITDNTNDGSPAFSPDGRFIAVSAGPEGGSSQGHEIYRLNADGSGRVRLTQTPLWVGIQPEKQPQWNNVAPAWSPDGSQIAFLTDRTGRWEIWLMNIDGSNQHPFFSEEINNQLNITYAFVDEHVLSWR
jgi:dipeptidyl aminopeptidase/acylaminoacyl peptidase